MYINKVFIYGNITRDLEIKQTTSGVNVLDMPVATNSVKYDEDKNKIETVEYHNIVVFGKQADAAAQWLSKGSCVFVEGRLQTQSWDDKETGQKRYKTVIICEKMQFGARRNNNNDTDQQSSTNEQKQEVSSEKMQSNSSGIDYPKKTIDPDSIPF